MRWVVAWFLISFAVIGAAGFSGLAEYQRSLDQASLNVTMAPEKQEDLVLSEAEAPITEEAAPAAATTKKSPVKKSTTPTTSETTSSTETSTSTSEATTAESSTTPAAPAPWRVVVIGDIADCAQTTDDEVASLVKSYQSTILLAGDNAYPNGSATDFANCFEPILGDAKARIYPTPGNHEYRTASAAGYFGYWGTRAGDPSQGYYAFSSAGWRVVALNTECSNIGGCTSGTPMYNWMRADLAANPTTCSLVFTHHPRFSSGEHGSDATLNDLWLGMQSSGVDIYLAGHDHTYERFTPSGGLTQFVVGTGGSSLYTFPVIEAGSAFRYNLSGGALVLDLYPTYYSWQYVTSTDRTVKDSGTTNCT